MTPSFDIPDRASARARRCGALAFVLAGVAGLAGCGGDDSVTVVVPVTPPVVTPGQAVPTAAEIAAAQAALDGTVPSADTIEARQAALDADADQDPT